MFHFKPVTISQINNGYLNYNKELVINGRPIHKVKLCCSIRSVNFEPTNYIQPEIIGKFILAEINNDEQILHANKFYCKKNINNGQLNTDKSTVSLIKPKQNDTYCVYGYISIDTQKKCSIRIIIRTIEQVNIDTINKHLMHTELEKKAFIKLS